MGERKREREWESHNYSDEPHRLGEKEHKRKNEEERSGNLAAENLFFGLRCVSGFGAKSTKKRGLWGSNRKCNHRELRGTSVDRSL